MSIGSGIFSFLGKVKSKFCIRADNIKNIELRANVSPAHRRLPAPNGMDLSNFGENLPDSSRKRSGLNSLGSSHASSSACAADNEEKTIAPCGTVGKYLRMGSMDDCKLYNVNVLYFWNIVAHECCVSSCRVR